MKTLAYTEEIRRELEELSEEKYRDFASSLIPGKDNLIGVRIPNIRKLAKRIVKEERWQEYLQESEHEYFEETMLQALIIGQLKEDIHIILNHVEGFIPRVDNWSVCDSFCNDLKVVKKHKEVVWEFIQPYWQSDKPYHVRVAVVLMLFYYINDEYLQRLFEIFDDISHEDYYVKMAVAWAVSMCFVKYPIETMKYLGENNLDDETYKKSLQKIRESNQVSKETKAIIKSMKR